MSASAWRQPDSRPVRTSSLMSIGEVLDEINDEFPEVRASKIRFLEEKGLITPRRTSAGYRKYTDEDVGRLRFILAVQRDQYLPLKVIKDYLDAVDAGERPESLPGGLRLEPRSVSNQLAEEIAGHIRPMTRAELQGMTGASPTLLDVLEKYRMIWPDETGRYSDHSLKTTRAAVALTEFGFEPRHLRAFRVAADRELGLVEQATSSVSGFNDTSRNEQVAELAREISAACLQLHSSIVNAEIADIAE